MTITLMLEAKVLGQKRPLFTDWKIELPLLGEREGKSCSLRDLITSIVVEEVEGFNQRQEQRRLVRVLSGPEIQQGIEKGKVDAGGRDPGQPANKDEAIATALQAFEDGLYYVFVDRVQQTDLDREVYVKSDSRVQFIRLVALAGG